MRDVHEYYVNIMCDKSTISLFSLETRAFLGGRNAMNFFARYVFVEDFRYLRTNIRRQIKAMSLSVIIRYYTHGMFCISIYHTILTVY